MKKQHKAAISFALALIFALVSLPASALPRFEAKAEITPAWTVPEGYNAHDYTKCVTFLEQTDENGVKNGEKLSETYNPNDPETWGVNEDWADRTWFDPPYVVIEPCFIWKSVNGEQRISKINVGGNSLVGPLDISGCKELVRLNCADCALTELDVSSNTELGALKCSKNSLTELDLSNNTALTNLKCDGNRLTELDISNNTALFHLSCCGNRLTELDLSNSNIHLNPFSMIKAEGDGYIGFVSYWWAPHTVGVYLYAYPANGVYGPDFEGFYLDSGELISHGWCDESGEKYEYYCGTDTPDYWPPNSTVIARFSDELPYNAHDFEKCRAFLEQTDENGVKNGEKLSETYDPYDPETWGSSSWDGEHFQWTAVNGEQRLCRIKVGYVNEGHGDTNYGYSLCGSLDVSGCTALEYLDCATNDLTELDVTGCTALWNLFCPINNLTELDVTGCTALLSLTCNENNLTELDVTGHTTLKNLYCSANNLTELDVTGCTALEYLNCSGNSLTELDVSLNTALRMLLCSANNLIELDLSRNTALVSLYCQSNNLAELDVSLNTALVGLDCRANSLAELDVSLNTALMGLYCQSNNLTELDVSRNTELRTFWCHNNNLTELDVQQNTALEELNCSGNSLTELDVTGCTALEYLDCSGNSLTELDLSNNPRLAFDHFYAEGSGSIGYAYGWYYIIDDEYSIADWLCAKPMNGASFDGFYDETGALVSEGKWSDYTESYYFYFDFWGLPTGTIIARFSGGYTPGDLDGNGSVTIADAIMALRLAMGLLDGSGLNTDAADMDGNGSITIADAISVLRISMGLS